MDPASNAEESLNNLEILLDRGPGNSNLQQPLSDLNLRLVHAGRDGELTFAEKAFQLLGTAVGKERNWQDEYRKSAILGTAIHYLGDESTSLGLGKQCLRVVGNTVADNDTNREFTTKDLKSLVFWLQYDELTTTALAVMLNLCNDYDPAQAAAAVLRLDSTIAGYLAKEKIAEAASDYAADVLTWTTEKLTADQLKDDTSVRTFNDILKVTLQYDEDHYHEYVAILVHYLQDPEFQQKIVTPDTLGSLVDLMIDFEGRLTPEEISGAFKELATHKNPESVVPEETTVILMAQLTGYISSVSATDAFVQNFDARSPVVKKAVSRLSLPNIPPSTVCASVMLGNLATSDQACIDMVQNQHLHKISIKILSTQTEPALLFATAGFMRHLTFPESNRSILGEAGLIEVCCQLLANVDPSVRGEAAAILGKLVSNNLHNIEKITCGKLPESITPAQISGYEVPNQPTILYHITTQALAPSAPLPSTSMKNAMIELAKTIIAILRYLAQPHPGKDLEAVSQEVYKTPLIAKPITRLVRQRFYADARSEGLLGLGLMAQSQDGATLIIREILEDKGLLESIKNFAIDQKKEGGDNDATAGRDYQNAVVLLHGLMMNGANAMDPALKDDMDALQAELSKLLI